MRGVGRFSGDTSAATRRMRGERFSEYPSTEGERMKGVGCLSPAYSSNTGRRISGNCW